LDQSPVYLAVAADFAAARLAFDARDIGTLNVLANRLMGDVALANEPQNRHYMLIGFLLKDVAGDLGQPDLNEAAAEGLFDNADAFIDVLEGFLTEQPFKPLELWTAFNEYTKNWRQRSADQYEKKAYGGENIPFTKTIVRYFFETALLEEAVYDPKARLFDVAINEFVRAFRTLGSQPDDVLFYSLVVSLERIAQYRRFQASHPQGFDQTLYKRMFEPAVQKVLSYYRAQKTDETAKYVQGSETLCDLIVEWRKLFLTYYELARITAEPGERRRIELPAKARERIVESVTKAIEKDLSAEKPTEKPGKK